MKTAQEIIEELRTLRKELEPCQEVYDRACERWGVRSINTRAPLFTGLTVYIWKGIEVPSAVMDWDEAAADAWKKSVTQERAWRELKSLRDRWVCTKADLQTVTEAEKSAREKLRNFLGEDPERLAYYESKGWEKP